MRTYCKNIYVIYKMQILYKNTYQMKIALVSIAN